ncbi:DUF6311 domain-containing protein [Paenibacillus sp. MSJ-34]|uniref:DUF6311 domain-containing protein n=1 Tax=Paenibacillus sp. MSJ-34 TaxID=2841529 RepID=UPI001C11FA87|nr:DUF6311 domain-containing protein [Paenibacillus sp. MSJ-34]MBU5444366.1 hypothetical protein [Paenibacillus sp. MSJ-34]
MDPVRFIKAIESKKNIITLIVFILIFVTSFLFLNDSGKVTIKSITASAQYPDNVGGFSPYKVIDKSTQEDTTDYWLLPDHTNGWIKLDLDHEYTITSIKILNTNNSYFKDRGTLKFDLVFIDKNGNETILPNESLPQFPEWKEYIFSTGEEVYAKSIQININEYYMNGGGLNEVEINGYKGDLGINVTNNILLCFFLSITASTIIYCLITGKNGTTITLVLGGILGIIVFLYNLGIRILNPTYIDWLVTKGDPATHFLGWHFFRNEPWHFPIGLISNYGAPEGTAIALTDSIPLLAIIFKLFNIWLPPDFQYFGFWILICYILQGIFASLLMKTINKNVLVQVLGTILFTLSPIMLWRAYGHYALMGHWTILASIWLLFANNKKFPSFWWIGIICISILIHPYLFIMVIGLCFIGVFEAYFVKKLINNRFVFIYSITCAVLIIFILWMIGYFSIRGGEFAAGGFGNYSMNLNSVINPQGWSSILVDRQNATPGQNEGFNYLGVGVMVLIFWSLYELVKTPPTKKVIMKLIPIGLVCLIFTTIAISNVITFDGKVFTIIPIQNRVLLLFETIRASGRFFWPVYYLIMYFIFRSIIPRNHNKPVIALLLIALVIQYVDINGKMLEFRNDYMSTIKWDNPLKSELWNTLDGSYSRIIFVPVNLDESYVPFSYLAVKKGMSINVGYFARYSNAAWQRHNEEVTNDLKKGNFYEDAIYIIRDSKIEQDIVTKMGENDFYGIVDGFNIFIPNGKHLTKGSSSKTFEELIQPYELGSKINFGNKGNAKLYQDTGWSEAEGEFTWTNSKKAILRMQISKVNTNLKLDMRIFPLVSSKLKNQKLIVRINEHLIDELNISKEGNYIINIERELLSNSNEVKLEFELPNATTPVELGLNNDLRTLGVAFKSLKISEED